MDSKPESRTQWNGESEKNTDTTDREGGFPGGAAVKESARPCRGCGSDLWLWRSPGGGNGNPLQYSRLENPVNREAWCALVQGVTKSWTWLSNWAGMPADTEGTQDQKIQWSKRSPEKNKYSVAEMTHSSTSRLPRWSRLVYYRTVWTNFNNKVWESPEGWGGGKDEKSGKG